MEIHTGDNWQVIKKLSYSSASSFDRSPSGLRSYRRPVIHWSLVASSTVRIK